MLFSTKFNLAAAAIVASILTIHTNAAALPVCVNGQPIPAVGGCIVKRSDTASPINIVVISTVADTEADISLEVKLPEPPKSKSRRDLNREQLGARSPTPQPEPQPQVDAEADVILHIPTPSGNDEPKVVLSVQQSQGIVQFSSVDADITVKVLAPAQGGN